MINLECGVCGYVFEGEVPWDDCPKCEQRDKDSAYQRPPIDEPFPEEPNTFLLEIIIKDDKVAGFGGSPRAAMWLQGVLDRQKAYLSELADYGRTVARLRGEVEKLRGQVRLADDVAAAVVDHDPDARMLARAYRDKRVGEA